MTNHWVDIKNADVVLIMGGNAAEAHPCGFKWVTEAKAHNKARLIVVDPRFTRTASVADFYAPIRTGTDIVFLGTGASSYMDVPALGARGVTVHTIKGYGNRAVAEHTIALMFACARELARMDRAVRAGTWGPPLRLGSSPEIVFFQFE